MADNDDRGRHIMEVGDCICLDNRPPSVCLLEGDAPVEDDYPGCQFRLPLTNGGPIKSVAVNVTVTGRRHYRMGNGKSRSRCNVEFVGDGEPSTYVGAWVYFDSNW